MPPNIDDKLSFVSGHTGTTVNEVSLIAINPVLLVIFTRILLGVWNPIGVKKSILEFALFMLPQVLGLLGIISPAKVATVSTIIALVLVFIAFKTAGRRKSTEQAGLDMRCVFAAYRASLMIITCISILGVDFHAFPRRFAKAETYGTGLMDAGVGSIILTSAIPQGWRIAAGWQSTPSTPEQNTLVSSLRAESVRLGTLLAIGLARAGFIAVSGYQNHVGEYGLHWNFFLTLAVVRILHLVLLPKKVSAFKSGVLGAFILIIYQYILSRHGLIGYLHSDDRKSSLLSANKEGIFSVIGYFAMSLIGIGCGSVLYHLSRGRLSSDIHWERRVYGQVNQYKTLTRMFMDNGALKSGLVMMILWLLYWFASTYVDPVSRRACNAAYVLWMVALNFQTILGFIAAELVCMPRPLPSILWAVSSSMLPIFLVANLLTGAVNMWVDTLSASDTKAVLIVSLYMLAVSAVGNVLYKSFKNSPSRLANATAIP